MYKRFLFITAISFFSSSYGFSCLHVELKDLLKSSEKIFHGKVYEVKKPKWFLFQSEGHLKVKILRTWKGSFQDSIKIKIHSFKGATPNFEKTKEYIFVFDGVIEVDPCTDIYLFSENKDLVENYFQKITNN